MVMLVTRDNALQSRQHWSGQAHPRRCALAGVRLVRVWVTKPLTHTLCGADVALHSEHCVD